MKRLTKTFATTNCKTMDDTLVCLMATIEDGLLASGFVPEKDYQRKDLFAAAMPMVYSMFNENNLLFTTSWPDA